MSLILDKINYFYSKGTAFESKALKNISLSIPDGEFIGLIGHTGSGKSTLIQHMNGLIKADSGSVYYNGQDIYDKDFKMTELRRKVGLVFQYPEHQLFESTVIKDVLFGPKNIGLSQLEAEVAAYGAIRAVGLPDDLIDASPFELSGGQKRRVAIAGVLAMSPEILILDEPTAGLDPAGRTEILSLLKSIKDEKGISIAINAGGSRVFKAIPTTGQETGKSWITYVEPDTYQWYVNGVAVTSGVSGEHGEYFTFSTSIDTIPNTSYVYCIATKKNSNNVVEYAVGAGKVIVVRPN